jgi:hypothetical protein
LKLTSLGYTHPLRKAEKLLPLSFGATLPRNFIAVNKEVNPMKEIMQFSNRVAGHRKSSILRMLVMPALLVAVSIVLGLSSPVPTTSATAKDAHRSRAVLVQDECEELPQEGDNVCTTERNGSQTCTRNFREPFSMEVTNPCTDESVLIEGEMHMVTHTTINRNSTHTRFHIEMHGTGTTTDITASDGVKYLFASTRASRSTDYTFSTSINGGRNSGPPPENFSDPTAVELISHGGSPNFVSHFVLHINTTPSGQTTCVVHTNESCSGQGEIIGR